MNPSPIHDRRPGLKPPQFGMGTMLALIAIIGVVLGLFKAFGALAAVLAFFFFCTIGAHIAGNFLGSRLRENGDTPSPNEPEIPLQTRRPSKDDFAPHTNLSHRLPLGIKLVAVVVGVGIVVGGIVGAVWLASSNWEQATLGNLLMGSVAFGALGGMGGFMAGGFLYVLGGALKQALSESK